MFFICCRVKELGTSEPRTGARAESPIDRDVDMEAGHDDLAQLRSLNVSTAKWLRDDQRTKGPKGGLRKLIYFIL